MLVSIQKKPYSVVMNWLRCILSFAAVRSAGVCICGSRSSIHHPIRDDDMTLATAATLTGTLTVHLHIDCSCSHRLYISKNYVTFCAYFYFIKKKIAPHMLHVRCHAFFCTLPCKRCKYIAFPYVYDCPAHVACTLPHVIRIYVAINTL